MPHKLFWKSVRSIIQWSHHSQLIFLLIKIITDIYNTILKGFIYILNILVDQWVSSISIESMREFCIGTRIVYSISIEKLVWLWKEVDLKDVNNIVTQFCTCFISFKCTCLTDILSAEHFQLLH